MSARYVVRRELGDSGYSVWDNELGKLAASDSAHLGFDEALGIADRLNAGQPVAQQQQQIQPKKEE